MFSFHQLPTLLIIVMKPSKRGKKKKHGGKADPKLSLHYLQHLMVILSWPI